MHNQLNSSRAWWKLWLISGEITQTRCTLHAYARISVSSIFKSLSSLRRWYNCECTTFTVFRANECTEVATSLCSATTCTYADNVALSASAHRCCSNRSKSAHQAQQQTCSCAVMLLWAHADGTGRRKDAVQFRRHCSKYYVGGANSHVWPAQPAMIATQLVLMYIRHNTVSSTC